jgi:hypothetical protein
VPVLGGVLAEGGEEDAVLEGEASDRERCEDLGDWFVVWLGIGGCAAGRVL